MNKQVWFLNKKCVPATKIKRLENELTNIVYLNSFRYTKIKGSNFLVVTSVFKVLGLQENQI